VNAEAGAALHEAQRALAAGEALWRGGLVPEAHAAMASTLRATLRAWAAANVPEEPSGAETRSDQTLAALAAAGYRDVDRLRAALAATGGADATTAPPAPRAEADVEWIWAEVERLLRFVSRRLRSARARKRARIRGGAVAGAAILLALVLGVRMWGRPRVRASDRFGPEYPASYAVDGIESTEWLLPDRAEGWLDVTFRSARRVRRVVLVNSHNRNHLDRAAERVRVTAYSDQGQVGAAEGTFPAPKAERSALELPLDARNVTSLRIEVLSYFGLGGGLAEVEVR
jgi:hypothetical protein